MSLDCLGELVQVVEVASPHPRHVDIAFEAFSGTPTKPDWAWYATGPGCGIQTRSGRLVIPCDHIEAGTKKYFSHVIYWDDRLEVDHPTIPLAELLLEKMQIYQINEKDVIDTMMLLLEHPLGDNDNEVINIERIAQLLAKDWGLWRTTTMNLDKVKQMAGRYSQMEGEQQTQIVTQVETAKARIEAEPKSRGWRLRDRVGDRVKWYKEVDEVE